MIPRFRHHQLGEAIRETLQEFRKAMRNHEIAFVGTVALLTVLDLAGLSSLPWLSAFSTFAVAPFAMLIQADATMPGRTLKSATVFGPGGRTLALYALDGALLALFAIAASIAVLALLRPPPTPLGALQSLAVMSLVGPLATARVSLRLAGRVCGDRRSWRAIWALTRGHALEIAVGLWACLCPCVAGMLFAQAVLGPLLLLNVLVTNGLSVMAIGLAACHLSVRYRALTKPEPAPVLALPAPSR